jgi:DNA-directed RNA polymerase I, II, and III subunit RPABC2
MEQVRFNSRIIHPEVQSISRESVSETLNQRQTDPYFTKYEYTTLIGTRAQELADGAKPLVSLDKFVLSSPRLVWEIAEKEVLEKKLAAFIIHRQLPGGKSEYWSATELTVIW